MLKVIKQSNESFSEWAELLFGVLQGSILDPLLFTTFLCDLFYFEKYIYIASYADDSTPYNDDSNIENTISSLESTSVRYLTVFICC